jgi:hypothetical protein
MRIVVAKTGGLGVQPSRRSLFSLYYHQSFSSLVISGARKFKRMFNVVVDWDRPQQQERVTLQA